MDKRTVLTAIMKRVPEVYFAQGPKKKGDKAYWCLWANIKGKPYKLLADTPLTSLVSHKELLNTMISEVYDEVAKIKSGQITPELPENERGLSNISEEDLRLFSINTMEDAINDDPISFLDAAQMPAVKVPEPEKPKLIIP